MASAGGATTDSNVVRAAEERRPGQIRLVVSAPGLGKDHGWVDGELVGRSIHADGAISTAILTNVSQKQPSTKTAIQGDVKATSRRPGRGR